MDKLKKERIAIEVIKTLIVRFDNFPKDASGNRNAPFHKAFLKAFSEEFKGKVANIPFFISLSSWMHGLSTTLGQSFFENIAHILSDGEKKEFTKKRNTLLKISQKQKNDIANIITDLKNDNEKPDLSRENAIIFSSTNNNPEIDANNFTVDVFYKGSNEVIGIELKSVRPNAGEMRGEKQKILEAKASLFHKYPSCSVKYYIGFPFDPLSNTPCGYNKSRFLPFIIDGAKYFDEKEVLVSSELWDFLSNQEKTMEEILEIINKIATPKFIKIYNFLDEGANRTKDSRKYLRCLSDWHLDREAYLVKNDGKIQKLVNDDKNLTRIYNQSIFKNNNYNSSRFNSLANLLK